MRTASRDPMSTPASMVVVTERTSIRDGRGSSPLMKMPWKRA
jgi:hypothetical protein